MIPRLLLCVPLLATVAAAQVSFDLKPDEREALERVRAQAAAQKPQTIIVNTCWRREESDSRRDGRIYDSAKLPQDFCVRAVDLRVVGDGGTMSVHGEYTPAGETARRPVDAAPQDLSSYHSSVDGQTVYSAYVFSEANAHGDTGSVIVSFRETPDGKVVPGTTYATFGVGCPGEECQEGEEPGVRVTVSDWR
jgi:hypothetical protein